MADRSSVAMLSAAERADVQAAVQALEGFWIRRGIGFFTLGIASYIDGVDGVVSYHRLSHLYNALLLHHFGWLYVRLVARLQSVLGAPVELAHGLAWPGFHLWREEGITTAPTASVHRDLQYLVHRWPTEADLEHPISCTLPIRLPALGGGLNVWEGAGQDGGGEGLQPLLESLPPPTYVPYEAGRLVVHDGLRLHQIAPVERVFAGDVRLTLQGHGIFAADRWLLYW